MARRPRVLRKRPPKPPTGFTHKLPPAVLRLTGPVVKAVVSLPEAERTARASLGRAIPDPVGGLILIDTGANVTCISRLVAEKLELKPLRIEQGWGAGGKHQNPVYFVRLEVSFVEPKTGLGQTFSWEREAQGIPNLENASKQLNLVLEGHRMDYIALMGRDLLALADFEYHGSAGMFKINFDMKSLEAHQQQ